MSEHIALATQVIGALGLGDEAAVLSALASLKADDPVLPPLLRAAIHHQPTTPLFYRNVLNLWKRLGRPRLKPTGRAIGIEILSDVTVSGMAPYLELFVAAYGITAELSLGDFDSVEMVAFGDAPAVPADVTILLLSHHWLRRQLGGGLISRARIADATNLLGRIFDGLSERRPGQVLVTRFSQGPWPSPGGSASSDDGIGWNLAVDEVNAFLARRASPRLHLLDTAQALHVAGGRAAAGRLAYLRSRAAFEEKGLAALAREAASGIAQLFGRSHRALLTDWDNTLWGGEIAELGPRGIRCGPDSPEALGYHLLQTYVRDLRDFGVLIAAVSRNPPEAERVFAENDQLALERSDFACLALSWGDKSNSVTSIQKDLNFDVEFMVYLDDSPVDLIEVLLTHPAIDVVLAGPSPDITLDRLSQAMFFNALHVSGEDRTRASRAAVLVRQQKILASDNGQEFLASLNIRLSVRKLDADTLPRVAQLLQKTNQFNLTSRRHGTAELTALAEGGAEFGIFHYTDDFGPQGIIAVVILLPRAAEVVIDTWLMSCRVLNRTIENAVLQWILQRAGNRAIIGEYIASDKNRMVADLFPRFGFERIEAADTMLFRLLPDGLDPSVTTTHATILYEPVS